MKSAVHGRTSIQSQKATAAVTPLECSAADAGTMCELGGEIKAAAVTPPPANATGTGPAAALSRGDAGPVPDMV
jgi:hypothetical protein